MRWIIHIGAPKTGSTSIQRFLFAERQRLRQHGFLYPDVSLRGYGHHDIAFMLHGSYPDWATRQDQSLPALASTLRATLASGQPDATILSSENFYLYPNPAGLRDFLRSAGMARGDDLRIICYVRRQDEAAVSWYNQTVKAQGNAADFESTLRRDRDLWDYAGRLKLWQTEFGTASLVVRDYSPFAQSQADVRRDLLGIVSLPVDAFELPDDRANERLSRDVLEFQRLVNRLPLGIPAKRRYHKRLIELTSATAGRGIFDDSPFISASRRIELVQSYATGNAWVARTFLGRDELFAKIRDIPADATSPARRGLTPAKIALILKWMLSPRSQTVTDHAGR